MPFTHSCCEHQLVAGLHSYEHIVAFAITPFFSKAQAPGGSGAVLAEATAKLAGSATAPASNATFTTDIRRISSPIDTDVSSYIDAKPAQAMTTTHKFQLTGSVRRWTLSQRQSARRNNWLPS